MATTKARVEELEATVEHLQERVDRLRDEIAAFGSVIIKLDNGWSLEPIDITGIN